MSEAPELELDEYTFSAVRDRIQSYSGVYVDESRRRSLTRLLTGRLSLHGLQTWAGYLALLDSTVGQEELTTLLEDIVNNETAFFRNARHFRLLAEVVFPEWARTRTGDRPLRLWSAGCSTGQEAYSLAITVAEALGLPPRRPVEIIATDISRRALAYAQHGLYTEREMRLVDAAYWKEYFQPVGTGYRVKEALRDMVRFKELNLVAEPLPALVQKVDVIFCRNVTIYFQIETSRRLMANLHRCLNEGGYLFIGFSETLWQVFDAFERVQNGGVFFYRKGSVSQLRRDRPEVLRPPLPTETSVERPLYLGTAPAERADKAPRTAGRAVRKEYPAHGHYHRGMANLRDGAYPAALEAFRAALRAEPNLVEAYIGMAQVYANEGRYAQGLQACEQALELDDLAEEAYLLRGVIYRQIGKTQEAIADLERATYLNPTSPTASYYLGDAFLSLREKGRALQAFRRTWRALLGRPDDALIDGVPVHLLREACRRHMETLTPGRA